MSCFAIVGAAWAALLAPPRITPIFAPPRCAPPRCSDSDSKPPDLSKLIEAFGEVSARFKLPRRAPREAEPRRRKDRGADGAAPQPSVVAWLVLCRPLVRDQMTLELAARVNAAVDLLSRERPQVVCFCGDGLRGGSGLRGGCRGDSGPPALVRSSSSAYSFFRTLAEARGLDVAGTRFLVEEGEGAQHGVWSTAMAIREKLRSSEGASPPAVRVVVISTSQHLQRMREIDGLMPRYSCLQTFAEMRADVGFEHVPPPYAFTDLDARRHARHVRLAGQLDVIATNLEAISDRAYNLHPESVQRLAETRNKLSEELWGLVPEKRWSGSRAPLVGAGVSQGGGTDADATCELEMVEVAVGCLGRAQDALAPLIESPIHGQLGDTQLQEALRLVTKAATSLRMTDPDRPLAADEWEALLAGRPPRSPVG